MDWASDPPSPLLGLKSLDFSGSIKEKEKGIEIITTDQLDDQIED